MLREKGKDKRERNYLQGKQEIQKQKEIMLMWSRKDRQKKE